MAKRPRIIWMYQGETLSIEGWSERTGIPYDTLYYRREIQRKPLAQALGYEPMEKRVPVPTRIIETSDGQRGTYQDWSERTGIPVNTIKKRYITMKWSADETMGLVPRSARPAQVRRQPVAAGV